MAKAKYTFEKLPRAMSYRSYLEHELGLMSLRGAKIKLKEYKARIPKSFAKSYEMSSKQMKEMSSTLVVLESGGKVIAHALLTNEFWFGTLKTSAREETDDMKLSAHANFLTPLGKAIDERF
jgi:hypothetical protein